MSLIIYGIKHLLWSFFLSHFLHLLQTRGSNRVSRNSFLLHQYSLRISFKLHRMQQVSLTARPKRWQLRSRITMHLHYALKLRWIVIFDIRLHRRYILHHAVSSQLFLKETIVISCSSFLYFYRDW